MIDFSHVYKTYAGPVHALKDVNLSIERGEFIFLTGPSGAGKTTLFRLLSAYDKPTSGRVEVVGYGLDTISSAKVPYYRRKIGVVFQDFKLLEEYNVFDNIAMPLKVLGFKKSYVQRQVREVLGMVGLRHKPEFFPNQLSGGEKQRVSIARALVHRPELLIADEPTGNLDPDLSKEIIRIFEKINAQGTTVLVATHDHSLVKSKKTKHLHLSAGTIEEVKC